MSESQSSSKMENPIEEQQAQVQEEQEKEEFGEEIDLTKESPITNQSDAPTTPPDKDDKEMEEDASSTELKASQKGGVNAIDRIFRLTKEVILEGFGKAKTTVDPNLQLKLEELRETKRRYSDVLTLGKKYQEQIAALSDTTRALSALFLELGVKAKNEEIRTDMSKMGEVHNTVHQKLDSFEPSVGKFYSSLNTMRNIAIQDTVDTISKYEQARLHYDAYQLKYTELLEAEQKGKKIPQRVAAAKEEAETYRKAYEQLKEDVDTKIDVLNNVMVLEMHNQSASYLKTFSEFFSLPPEEQQKMS